ncbi:sialic acid-binding Ig-like lectin 11 [Sinocyclocheilus grahami]|uniref:sialic acid-binding Ig-like lectin 11 n=1 Tax=Sinocyclocheilus grahami TaxID=75366 RepID=UPI0007AC90A5|nr:PREDICTED: sialic acid-binding Ig-like lectin 11 [Sinocyclocheilus grahami]
MKIMETLVPFLLTGSLIQGGFCGFNINLPKKVEALKGSCVFIPCTFDIDQKYKDDLTDSAKRMWFKDESTAVFDSSSPNNGPFKGEIFGTATQKNCTTRFDNVDQSHDGSYYFRLEANGKLQYNYKEPTHSRVQMTVLGSPPKPTLSIFPDQQETTEGSSVSLRCSTKIFCPSRPPSLTWSSSLIESITGQQYQSQTELISDLNFTVSHRHHRVTFNCTATHQLQQPSTSQESRRLRVQYAPKNTSVRINPAGLVLEGRSVTLICSRSPPKPTLSIFPDQQETTEGSSVSLRCSTKIFCPSRPPSLTWSSSLIESITGQQYQSQTELISDLNFTVSHRHHRVTFTCTATHQLQQPSTSQESRRLRVQYAPKNTSVRINPAGLVLEGRSVTLICSSDANPAVNYTWYRDTERPLNPVQTGSNLTINNTDPTHSGRYYCTAENTHGTQNSSVLLDVQYAPKNTSLSAFPSSSVMEGNPVTLSCSTDANPAVNYTWYRDAERPLNPVETGPNLTINNTDPTHIGRYYCTAENTHGTQNSSVLLDIQYAPKNTSLSAFPSSSVMEGDSVTLSCSTDANPAVNYTWYRDAERPLNPVQTGSNLTINNTDPTHSGRYYCTAENTHGTQNSSVLLDVQYAPKNTSLSAFPSSSVMEGNPVTLICSSDANPAVNYTWYRDAERPLNPVQTGSNLTINNTDPTHSGRYYCTAENTHGTQNSSVLLDVQFAPKISSSCSRSSVMACVCEAHGNPCPTLEWRLSGYVLANSTETSISEETLGSTGVKSVLNIHQSLTDTDVLQCFSTNKHGSCSQQFQAVPPPQDTRFHHPSVLLGAAVGASVMMIVCIVMLCYERRRKEKPSEPRQDDRSGLILTQTAVSLDNDSEFVYANKGMRSSTAPSAPESLHYSSIDFTNADPPSAEIRGIASLTSEYAAVRQRPAGAADAENNTSTSETEPKKTDMTAKIPDTSSPASEDVIYGNMSHRYRPKEALVSADDAEKQD